MHLESRSGIGDGAAGDAGVSGVGGTISLQTALRKGRHDRQEAIGPERVRVRGIAAAHWLHT